MLPWIRSWFTIIASTPIHLGSFTISYKERKKVKEKMVIQVKISLIPDVKSKKKWRRKIPQQCRIRLLVSL